MMRLVCSVATASICFGGVTAAEESLRVRLAATPLESELTVELVNGQVWSGTLIDIPGSGVRLLAEPDEAMRKRMRLPSGAKLKKTLSFADVVAVDGAINGDLLDPYVVLQSEEAERMQTLLTLSAEEGFRVLAGAGRSVVILEKGNSAPRVQYVVPPDVRETREEELNDWGRQGFWIARACIRCSSSPASRLVLLAAEPTAGSSTSSATR